MSENKAFAYPDDETDKPLSRAQRYFNKFVEGESAGGVLLLICTIIALIFANVPCLKGVTAVWEVPFNFNIGTYQVFGEHFTIGDFINDALMAIFFFTVGLEIKREMTVGQLSSVKKATLPVFAALGGMIFPALIFTIFNHSNPATSHGWGVPMATDIAFAIGILAILGKKAPIGIKVFLTAIAIADDLGSIIVLAIFYPSHAIQFTWLIAAFAVFGLLCLLGKVGVRKVSVTVIGGLLLWYFVYLSGVHATIAGVLLAISVPYKTKINELKFGVHLNYLLGKFKECSNNNIESLANDDQMHIIHEMSEKLDDAEPLMHKFESKLQPIVNFFIMPIFALTNAAVALQMDFSAPGIAGLSLGIFFGLLCGKPIGIFIFSWLSVKLKLSALPDGVTFPQIIAMGVLGGIGFTMSIFIDNLAFSDPALIETGKVAILITSATAAIVGYLLFAAMTKKTNKAK